MSGGPGGRLSRVAVIFTGGTISMRADPVAGGNVPSLDAHALVALTPGLADVADIVPIDLGLTPASHFTFPKLFAIADAVAAALDDPGVDGAVVVQGTDTIEETAFFFDILHRSQKPLVVTGAMRSASEPAYDGPANIVDAVRCAASPTLRGEGCVVVLAGAIHPADDVVKTHATSPTTFQSPNLGAIGHATGGGVVVARRRVARRTLQAHTAAEPVFLVTAVVASDGTMVEATRGYHPAGYVIEATGAGNTNPALLDACRAAMADGIPVVLTTRAGAGRAGRGYAFPGGGARWAEAGALFAGYLGGPKARIALALGLGAGLSGAALARFLDDPEAA